ncbi:unnamed protein product [Effrenium voratum]|nr:unnamed protein product [Effrenium voratum]
MGRARYTAVTSKPSEERTKAKLSNLPLAKLRARLEALAEQGDSVQRSVAFLVWSTECCPVQFAHREVLERARQVLELRGLQLGFAFLAPSKSEACLSLDLRAELCRKAFEEVPWIETCSWGWTGARSCGRILQQLQRSLAWSAGVRWDFRPFVLATEVPAESVVPLVCLSPLFRGLPMGHPCPTTAWRARLYQDQGVLGHCRSLPENLVDAECPDWPSLQPHVPEAVLEHLRRALADGSLSSEAGEASPASAASAKASPGEAKAAAPEALGSTVSALDLADFRVSAGKLHFAHGEAAKASQGSGRKVIAHLCNDQGNGGRGYFQAIKKIWGSSPSRMYFEWHRDRNCEPSNGFGLGAVQFVPVSPVVEIANMWRPQALDRATRAVFALVCGPT